MLDYECNIESGSVKVYDAELHDSGYRVQLVEIDYNKKKNTATNNLTNSSFKVLATQWPVKSYAYFFWAGDEIVGHTFVDAYANNTAVLCSFPTYVFTNEFYYPQISEYVRGNNGGDAAAIYVSPDCRRNGLGRTFLRATMSDLANKGISDLKVNGIVEKEKGFYEKMGIEIISDNGKRGIFRNLEKYLDEQTKKER